MTETATAENRGPGRPPKGIAKFTVEFGTEKNNGFIVLRSLKMHKARGAWLKSHVPGRLPTSMGSMPDIPGSHLMVDAKNLKGMLFDPVEKDKKFWTKYNHYVKTADRLFPDPSTYGPHPQVPFEFNPDDLKTLLFELLRMAEDRRVEDFAGEVSGRGPMVHIIEGRLPSKADVDELGGRQIYDPASNMRKPKYVEDLPEWLDKVDQATGV